MLVRKERKSRNHGVLKFFLVSYRRAYVLNERQPYTIFKQKKYSLDVWQGSYFLLNNYTTALIKKSSCVNKNVSFI